MYIKSSLHVLAEQIHVFTFVLTSKVHGTAHICGFELQFGEISLRVLDSI